MTDEEFKALSVELLHRFKGTGDRFVIVVVSARALLEQGEGPSSAGNCSADLQAKILRSVADSLDAGTATESFSFEVK